MDEPTSSLSEHEIDALFEQVHILKKNNVAAQPYILSYGQILGNT